MANEKAMWQRLLRMAQDKGADFGRLISGAKSEVLDKRVGMDISRKATEIRAQLPTTGDMATLRGRMSTQGDLRKGITAMITPVIAAAPASRVTQDVVNLGVQAGQQLTAAMGMVNLAEEKKDLAIAMLGQVEDATEQAAQLLLQAEKRLADANSTTIQIEVRIRRAITDIDGV